MHTRKDNASASTGPQKSAPQPGRSLMQKTAQTPRRAASVQAKPQRPLAPPPAPRPQTISQPSLSVKTPPATHQLKSQSGRPLAPQVYRPQPTPKVLQLKMAGIRQADQRPSSQPPVGFRGTARNAPPKAASQTGGIVQLARRRRQVIPIGEEGKVTVKNETYKGFLFINENPVYFDFSHSDTPWPITRDFRNCTSLEYESEAGKKRTLIPWPDGGINATYQFLNRNGSNFFRLIVTLE